ncbi:MAG TPA: DUF2207 domain-containing protein [Patescibacteria group bacterium]|nr:DUF2207 domain-containing protein [Patescibacteria group bacterium]
MKRRFLSFFLSLLLLILLVKPGLAQESWATPVIASSDVADWVIENFDSAITIPQDGKVLVVETIMVDFGLTAKHGIFRSIPTEGVRFDLKSVKQDGVRAATDVSSSGGTTTIRIGDPDRLISGQHRYEISYEMGKVITRFGDHDEFYWNVTGSDWEVPIRGATATVVLEGGVVDRVVCFTGLLGSQEANCTAGIKSGRGAFATTQALAVGEGFTITSSLPKDLVAEPFYLDDFLKPYWLILGSLFAAVYVIRRWWKHGRDLWYKNSVVDDRNAAAGVKPLFAHQTVVAEFDPPDKLRPGEVGTLVDEKVDLTDISATIVDLAVRGYLKIIEEKKGRKSDYQFEQKKNFLDDPKLGEWEKEILRGIFGKDGQSTGRVALTDLQDKFYTHLKDIRESLYAHLTEAGYFPLPPDKAAEKQIVRGLGLVLVAGLLFYIFTKMELAWVPIPVAVLAALTLITAHLMPRKTAQGTEAVRRASGFKLFISTGQKYQQQFNERVNYFDVFLPYAMVFGVVDKWVGAFKSLGIVPPQPTWYVGPGPFNIGGFSSSVNAMTSSFASTLPSQPASKGGSGFGGGGFSGGGFGGGGGGSW